jgi:hypothetical protein
MKKLFFLFGALTLLIGCNQPNVEQEKSNAEDAIKGFYSAAEKFDFNAMRSFCTADFHAIEDGLTYNNLDEFIAMAESLKDFTPQINLDIVKTDVDSKMAMSIVKFDAQFKNEETQMNFKTIENYLLKKVDGKWLIDFFQSTYLTDTKKLEKGSVLGIHVLSDIELKPGITYAQVEEFLLNTYFPAFNKLAEDFKMIPLKGLRGDNEDELAFIMYLESDDVRNSYWSSEGVLKPKGQELFQKLESVTAERNKLFTIKKDPYTDWRVE